MAWRDYEKLVLSELERANQSINKIHDKIDNNTKQIEGLKVKSGFWGSLSGMITVIAAYFIEHFFRRN